MKKRTGISITFPKSLIAVVCLLFGLMFPTAVVAVDAWEVVGTAGFSAGGAWFTSLAFNSATPYVAYMDLANSRKVTVVRLQSDPTPAPIPTLNERKNNNVAPERTGANMAQGNKRVTSLFYMSLKRRVSIWKH